MQLVILFKFFWVASEKSPGAVINGKLNIQGQRTTT